MVQKLAPGACLGVTKGQTVGFGSFFIVAQLWRNAFGILMCRKICDGAGGGICDGTRHRLALVLYSYALALCFGRNENPSGTGSRNLSLKEGMRIPLALVPETFS